MHWEEQVRKNLEQLKYEAAHEKLSVKVLEEASAAKAPSSNKRLKYLAAAPVGVLFTMLGLFLLLEIKAQRVADPDALSTRVRSEVYALPPLPNARSVRRLNESDASAQIEHFIQRLDHLRFAVCGNAAELGQGAVCHDHKRDRRGRENDARRPARGALWQRGGLTPC